MSEAATMTLKRLRPVKWSTVDKRVGPYRNRYVQAFLEFEGRPLENEDGSAMVNGKGYQIYLDMSNFAKHAGIARTTFKEWVYEVRPPQFTHPQSRTQVGEDDDSPESDTDAGEERPSPTTAPRCKHCSIHCPEDEGR